MHVTTALSSSSIREKTTTLEVQNPSFFTTMQGITQLLLSRICCTACNVRFWNICLTHPIWVHEITISSPKKKLRGTRHNTRDEIIRAIGRSIRNINKDGRAVDVRRLTNIWQKVINMGGVTILKVHKWCTLVNKAMSEISNCCHYFLYNTCMSRFWNQWWCAHSIVCTSQNIL